MTKPPWKNVPDVAIELRAACMPSEHASYPATTPGAWNLNHDVTFALMFFKFCSLVQVATAPCKVSGWSLSIFIFNWSFNNPLTKMSISCLSIVSPLNYHRLIRQRQESFSVILNIPPCFLPNLWQSHLIVCDIRKSANHVFIWAHVWAAFACMYRWIKSDTAPPVYWYAINFLQSSSALTSTL